MLIIEYKCTIPYNIINVYLVSYLELRNSGVQLINDAKNADIINANNSYSHFVQINQTCQRKKIEAAEACTRCVSRKCTAR